MRMIFPFSDDKRVIKSEKAPEYRSLTVRTLALQSGAARGITQHHMLPLREPVTNCWAGWAEQAWTLSPHPTLWAARPGASNSGQQHNNNSKKKPGTDPTYLPTYLTVDTKIYAILVNKSVFWDRANDHTPHVDR